MRNALISLFVASLITSPLTQAAGSDAVVSLSRAEIVANPDALTADPTISSGQPDAAVLDVVADSGYVAVVDLRGADEDRGMDEKSEVEARGMQYILLPVSSKDDVSFENAARLDDILQSVDGPVLVHCGSGNRVGALFALRARAGGASPEEALEAGKAAGMTSLVDTVESVMQSDDAQN